MCDVSCVMCDVSCVMCMRYYNVKTHTHTVRE